MVRVSLVVSVALALLGCGTPSTVGAATTRPAAAAQAAGAYKAHFVFPAYSAISAEERRVLEASEIAVGAEAGKVPMRGQALYDYLALHAPKLLGNYLNQTAVMATVRFEDGRTALSYVQRLEGLKINHVYAVVEPGLKDAIARQSTPKSTKDAAYVGPEDSSLMHGKYNTSFRENRPYTSQQFCFSASDAFTKVDIDLDEECPLAGSRTALAQHLLRAAKHEILRKWPGEQYGENSEPDLLYRMMSLAPVNEKGKPNKVGRGITPNYMLEKR